MDYLRNMMQDVGTSNRLGVFYVFSAHSVDSHFIEHVNTILAHGVTLGVFTTEDEHTIHTQLSEASEGKGLQRTTQEDLWELFVMRPPAQRGERNDEMI